VLARAREQATPFGREELPEPDRPGAGQLLHAVCDLRRATGADGAELDDELKVDLLLWESGIDERASRDRRGRRLLGTMASSRGGRPDASLLPRRTRQSGLGVTRAPQFSAGFASESTRRGAGLASAALIVFAM
jgi:hypothetical protein